MRKILLIHIGIWISLSLLVFFSYNIIIPTELDYIEIWLRYQAIGLSVVLCIMTLSFIIFAFKRKRKMKPSS